jgi:hypothetical protein
MISVIISVELSFILHGMHMKLNSYSKTVVNVTPLSKDIVNFQYT